MKNCRRKRIMISMVVTLLVNCVFLLEAALAYRRLEFLDVGPILGALSRPPGILAKWFLPSGIHGIIQPILLFAISIVLYFVVPMIVLEAWAWIRAGNPSQNRKSG
jgi:hypothetical protein